MSLSGSNRGKGNRCSTCKKKDKEIAIHVVEIMLTSGYKPEDETIFIYFRLNKHVRKLYFGISNQRDAQNVYWRNKNLAVMITLTNSQITLDLQDTSSSMIRK